MARKNNNTTLDDLARMVQEGFMEARKEREDLRLAMNKMHDDIRLINGRLDAIETELVSIRKDLKYHSEQKTDREETHNLRLRVAKLEDELAAIKKQL